MRRAIHCAPLTFFASTLLAQDPLVVAPSAYKVAFENQYVQIVRVHYGPKERIAPHDHTPLSTAYVYLNDSGPVVFDHIGADYSAITRSPTQAKAFRIYYGLPEVHAVVNTSDLPSDFLRVQFKTRPKNDTTFKGKFPALTYPPAENFEKVQVDHDQARITRLAIAPGKRMEIVAQADAPALLIAVTNLDVVMASKSAEAANATKTMVKGQPGADIWIDPGGHKGLENHGSLPAEFLRFDLKTPPMSADELAKKGVPHAR